MRGCIVAKSLFPTEKKRPRSDVEPFTLVLMGPVPTKKNKLRPRGRGKGYMNDPVVTAMIDALDAQIPAAFRNLFLEHPEVRWTFCVPELNADRDGKHTTLLDILKKAGVIYDDNMKRYNGREVFQGRHTPGQEETTVIEVIPAGRASAVEELFDRVA